MSNNASARRAHRERRGQSGSVVFDRGHTVAINKETALGLGQHTSGILFRITDRDRQIATTTVTHVICGDPAPGRRMPQDELTVERGRICTESGPVLLTFRELEAAKKLQMEGVAL